MKKHLLLTLLLFVIAKAQAMEPVRLGVSKNILSLPVVVAQQKGFFRKHGVTVNILDCPSGAKCMANMLEGQSDMATATELPVVLHGFKRQDFAIVATFVSSSNDLKVLAKVSANIKSPLDLEGKRVAFIPGTASQYFLDTVLIYNGVDPQRVHRQPMSIDEAVKAMGEGKLDAVSLWEPHMSIMRKAGGKQVQLVPVPRLYIETFNLIASERMIQQRPQDIPRILMAVRDGIAFIEDNPKAASALLVDRLGVDLATIESVLDDYRFKLSLNKSLPRTMDGQARWAMRAGHAPENAKQPNMLTLLAPQFLQAVDPHAVTVP
ncbi:MAG TPA: ABC transporter substrate-binding protein [Limnobacter sp.]|nr:ABC transporter substrate-binding protein [Limnobacter sp.]